MKTAQPEPRRRSALLSRAVTPTSSAGVALSRSGPRKRAVRWRLPSLLRTMPSSTSAAHGRKSARFCGLLRYSERLNMITSRTEVRRIADVPAHNLDEERVPLCGPDSGHVADRPQHEPGDPQPQSETESG